jgi:hypothetical protein
MTAGNNLSFTTFEQTITGIFSFQRNFFIMLSPDKNH